MEIKRTMERQSYLWNGVNKENLGKGIKILKETLKEMEKSYSFMRLTQINEDLLRDIRRTIEEEIEYCKFFYEICKREKEKTFNEWVYIPKEKRVMRHDWVTPIACWCKSNGRMKAIIEIDETGKRTKISLKIVNDSEILDFLDRNKDFGYKNLGNEVSIANQVEEYKEIADKYLEEHKFPRYCSEKRNMETLKELLRIE